MIPPALRSICADCLHRSFPRRPIVPSLQQCNSLRAASGHAPRAKPSRMVLSKTVARPPSSRPRKMNRKQFEGPFGGMNQTYAGIPEKKPKTTADGRSTTYGSVKKEDPRKALKMQRALATISYSKRMITKNRMQDIDSFDKMDLIPALKQALLTDALKGLVDVKPTPVQRLAIPELLGQGNYTRSKNPPKEFLLAAETGSGKTLAYLVPAINSMKLAEAQDTEIQEYRKRWQEERARAKDDKLKPSTFDEPHPTMARPKVVVLVPTAELVDQVGAVAKRLSHMVKFRTERLSATLPANTIHRNLYSPQGVDIVIATPHLLASIAQSDPNVLSRVTHLIIDEADSLLDRSFSSVTIDIIDKAKPSLKQFVVCSATIPKRLDSYLAQEYPDMLRITTPNLHAIPRRVQLGVIDVSRDPYRNNKNLACADAIYTIGREAAMHEGPTKDEVDVKRVIVFVNERENTEEVKEYLVSKGINAVALHRDTSEQRRAEIIASFTDPDPLRIPTPEKAPAGVRSLPNIKVVVATDLASRGIDTLAVRHVILYDIPHTTIDFIHRLGRAGRMGRRGKGIALVGNDDRRDIVAEVKGSMFMGQALV
ncbi:probable RNA helicase, mitochondrial [Cephalotrichum gorgonifer]|uniref:RNA helicase n=1 Tax=Cephalotrichum gorgonifer TaxID=2041049 RepID=A0AAE8N0Z1_9PEZI|nr:probable RNA helicase, mitochondrial [Cephalotrichum gorgonifer]